MWQNAHWSIIFLIEGILFLENWDYISKFKLVWKFILLKRRVDDLSEYWKVGEIKDSLNFKNEINFELSVKVKIICILKWNYFLIDFESKKKSLDFENEIFILFWKVKTS